jgi:hypothetical protein
MTTPGLIRGLKIVSGGQTGVDRGALEAARAAGHETGGWCPAGRRSEAGPIPPSFGLQETGSNDYATRTRWNVRDSDGTLLIGFGPLNGGSALTAEACREQARPLLILAADRQGVEEAQPLNDTLDFLTRHRVRILNVAGPRESEAPGARAWTRRFVARLLSAYAGRRLEAQP